MKFTEMPYERPNFAEFKENANRLLERITSAASAQEQIDAYLEFEALEKAVNTACSLAYVRHTINTKDEFYDRENSYVDEISPALQETSQKINLALLDSPFRPALEERFGKLLFTNLEISVRAMKPEIMDLMQEENRLQSEYQKLYASAMVEWEGQSLPLPKLGPFKQSPDRAVRRAAFEAEGRWFDQHQEELDRLGFDLSDFGGGSLAVRAVPDYVSLGDVEATLTEIAGKLALTGSTGYRERRDDILHTMACKAAIKGGWKSGTEELERVARAVMAGEVKYCPHGRPVAIELTQKQLEKQFKRS